MSKKEEKAQALKEASDAYRAGFANVASCQEALADAEKALEPAIDNLVALKGKSMQIRLHDGKRVLAKFRKNGENWLTSHEDLDGDCI